MVESSVLVRLQGLCYSYREAGETRPVLRNLEGEIRRGEYVALLGQSGSGKSTLLNLLAGLDAPEAGEVYIDDTAINRLSEKQRTLFRLRHIGFVYQFFNLLPTLSVAENVLLPLDLAGAPPIQRLQAMRLLDQAGLGERGRSYPDQLSGGEQQRVAIVRALAHDPLLVLADEPTGNLDSETSRTVLTLFDRLIRERRKTLLVVTHNPEIAARADRTLYLRDGRLTAMPP